MEREIGRIKYELEDYNRDFEALTLIENYDYLFTSEELSELRSLMGLYGLEIEKRLPFPLHDPLTPSYLGKRQGYWEQKSQWGRTATVRKVAEQAMRRYGLIANTSV